MKKEYVGSEQRWDKKKEFDENLKKKLSIEKVKQKKKKKKKKDDLVI